MFRRHVGRGLLARDGDPYRLVNTWGVRQPHGTRPTEAELNLERQVSSYTPGPSEPFGGISCAAHSLHSARSLVHNRGPSASRAGPIGSDQRRAEHVQSLSTLTKRHFVQRICSFDAPDISRASWMSVRLPTPWGAAQHADHPAALFRSRLSFSVRRP